MLPKKEELLYSDRAPKAVGAYPHARKSAIYCFCRALDRGSWGKRVFQAWNWMPRATSQSTTLKRNAVQFLKTCVLL